MLILVKKHWLHISTITQQLASLLTNNLSTKHLNIGINIDEFSGASVGNHLHIHFVPRYKGDTNFMTSIFDTRVYPNDFDDIYQKLKNNINKYVNKL